MNRERIFHFGRGVLALEDQYIHTSRENNSFETEYFWPIHTLYIYVVLTRQMTLALGQHS